MLKPLTASDDRVYHCTHEDIWPPAHARLGESFEQLLARGVIKEAKYHQLKTWERVCGLAEMDEDKCLTCPHVLVEHGRHKKLVPVAQGSVKPPNLRRLDKKTRRTVLQRKKAGDAP